MEKRFRHVRSRVTGASTFPNWQKERKRNEKEVKAKDKKGQQAKSMEGKRQQQQHHVIPLYTKPGASHAALSRFFFAPRHLAS